MSGERFAEPSLDSLRRCGTFCWYGPVLGGPGPLDIMSLPRSIKIGYAVFLTMVEADRRPRSPRWAERVSLGAGDHFATADGHR